MRSQLVFPAVLKNPCGTRIARLFAINFNAGNRKSAQTTRFRSVPTALVNYQYVQPQLSVKAKHIFLYYLAFSLPFRKSFSRSGIASSATTFAAASGL